MDRERHQRNYDLHSWIGVALGWFVYVVCFTGSIALFYHEILGWEDPAKRTMLPAEPIAFHEVFDGWVAERDAEGEIEFLTVTFPTVMEPYYSAFAHVDHDDGTHENFFPRWHPATAQVLPERKDGMARWLLDFHRDLMWPSALGGRTVGRALVGVAGVILMLAILSGVVAHTKITDELFTLRYWRSVRLKWQDTHKVLGLWGLPFYTMIAFTGAFLGIVAILAPLVAVLAFKGDQEALIEAVLGEPPQAVGAPADMMSLDDVITLRHPETGEVARRVNIHNWRDQGAVYDVFFEPQSKLELVEAKSYSGVTGEAVTNPAIMADTPALRVSTAITPLHYGTYGGITLKLLYLVLGMSAAVITAFGSMMWIERRLHGNEGHRSPAFYRALSRLNVGITVGVAVATAGLFVHNTLYSGTEAMRMIWTGWAYFAVWFAAIGYAWFRADDYRATKELITLTGAFLLIASALNATLTGHPVWFVLTGEGHAPTAWVDVALIVASIATFGIAYALPSFRVGKKRKPAAPATTFVSAE
ncbi:MAG: PepSY-associated TM helix domain-containing protein [Pseudomonadota bacterium]